ncbi:MAG: alpha/beta hydrolase [Nocardioidaceae bacterium]
MADLFPHYPSPPEELVGIAAQLISTAGDTGATVSDVRGGVDRAVDAVDGDLTFPMSTAPEPVIRNGADVARTARFASGAVMLFAEAVQTYNRGIDRINAQVQEGEVDVMSTGRAEKLARLSAEQARLEAELDAAASRVAGMLERGPNAEDMRFLREHGYLLPRNLLDSRLLRSALDGMPSGDDPEAMRRWWDSLSLAQQVAVMAAHPDRLGNADGLPAEVRDEANRFVMADDLALLEAKERDDTLTRLERNALANIRAAIRNLEARESHIDPITGERTHTQLYIYEPYAFNGDGRLAIATGNLDAANHVAVMVPGMGTNVQGMGAGRSLNVYDESRWASGDTVAVLDWVGYDAPSGTSLSNPDIIGVVNQKMARAGADLLAADVEGLRASRDDDPAHLTVIGNSYGSTTAGIAAGRFDLEADDLILTGSPGVPVGDAGDLSTGHDHTWVGSASRDFVTSLGRTGWTDPSDVAAHLIPGVELMGNDPAEDDFGANRFQAENVDRGGRWNIADHSRYYDQNTESLYNVAAITTGQYGDVQEAQHRYDPLADVHVEWKVPKVFGVPVGPPVPTNVDVDMAMQDPERDRTPTQRSHG